MSCRHSKVSTDLRRVWLTQEDGQRDERESPEPEARSGSLRDVFPGYFRPTDEEFDSLWNEGMFVVDTNVLLNLYRYSHSTRGELLAVLHALTDRLFLPHQVGQEFLERRLTTIQKQRRGFAKLRDTVTGFHEQVEGELRNVLRLRPGEVLPPELRESLEKDSPNGYATFAEQIERLEEGLPRTSNSPDMDEVWTAVEALFDGKVGPAYGEEERQKAMKEAEHRREAKVPPGFKDESPGDYLLWRQTIDEAKRSGRPVVLVTDDRKEDWWWIEEGETLGPRRQLVVEMREEARMLFYMYTPDRLMQQARERLGVLVSDESISEAEGVGEFYDRWEVLAMARELFGPSTANASLEERYRVSEVVYVEDSELLEDETEREITPLDWASIIQTLKDRRQALSATVFAEGIPELRGDVLVITFPTESDFYAREGRKSRHLDTLKDVVEDVVGVRPRLVLKVEHVE